MKCLSQATREKICETILKMKIILDDRNMYYFVRKGPQIKPFVFVGPIHVTLGEPVNYKVSHKATCW